jgi:hypothetical protein
MLADRMMRGEEGSELEASRFLRRHGRFSGQSCYCWLTTYELRQIKAIGGIAHAAMQRHPAQIGHFDRIYSSLPFG